MYPQWFLLSGILLSFAVSQNENIQLRAKTWSTRLLQISVVLLGSSLNFNHVIKQGAEGVVITFLSIIGIFLLGYLAGRILNLDKKLNLLITMGTAICGGSAIGALAPIIAADTMTITISFAIVFFLNAIAVFVFPLLGNLFQLSQDQFGLWAALAIHDTSSVVAASTIYGQHALETATTIKLTRALWIIPITFSFGFYQNQTTKKKLNLPWFIFAFLAFSLAFTFIPPIAFLKDTLLSISKAGFSLTLFFIGLTFNMARFKEVGIKPFLFGFGLWIIVSITSLMFII